MKTKADMLYNFNNTMNKKTKLNLFAIPLVLFFLLSFFVITENTATAQTKGLGPNAAIIKMTPKNPLPGNKIRLSLYATSFDTDVSLITWFINGKIVQQAYSKTSYEFTAGEVGSTDVIDVRIEEGGKVATARKVLRVSDIDIIWEGNTYTPPFYKGRSLKSPGSSVNIVAIPRVIKSNGVFYKKDELSYVWRINYSTAPYKKGRGVDSVTIQDKKPFGDFSVTVQVKDPTGSVRAIKKIKIPSTQPKLLLYEDNPLIGINYDNAVKNSYGIYGRDATFVAEPYYMNTPSRTDPSLKYTWSVLGTEYTTPGSLTFGPGENSVSGTASLSLVVQNSKFWLQNARSNVQIDFGQKAMWGGDINPDTKGL